MTSLTINASCLWCHTGYQLEGGQSYLIEVPEGQTWKDWYLEFGPEGGMGPVQRLSRWGLRHKGNSAQPARFLTLIGTIGESLEHAFTIGKGPVTYQAPISGELVGFANDLRLFYFNNTGSIQLNISPLK